MTYFVAYLSTQCLKSDNVP